MPAQKSRTPAKAAPKSASKKAPSPVAETPTKAATKEPMKASKKAPMKAATTTATKTATKTAAKPAAKSAAKSATQPVKPVLKKAKGQPAASTPASTGTAPKAKAPAKAPGKAKSRKKSAGSASTTGIRLLQLAPQGQVTDPVFEAWQPQAGAWTFSAVLDALFATQRDASVQKSTLWGVMTLDFTSRTGLSGDELLKVIAANPGFDLYYASAHPEVEAAYHNPWRSPEVTHPGFVELSRRFLKAAGLSDAPVDAFSDSALFATGHLMVATPEIWGKYLAFVETVFAKAQKNLSPADHDQLFKEAPVKGRMTHLSLIVARLLSVFLMLKGSAFKAYKIPLPAQERVLNPHLLFLRDLKDMGLAQQSKWHLAAWLNYRGLYMAHVMGKAWILKHINAITPTDVHMAMPVPQVVNPYRRAVQAQPKV